MVSQISFPEAETAFHSACFYGKGKIVEMLMQNSVKFNIDLNLKGVEGQTAFHLACAEGKSRIVKMYRGKMI